VLQLVESGPLDERIARVSWYHSLKLPGGHVTPGSFDTQDELERIPFPASLRGMRCLDVATADGFWAFEMERRGAAEVIAIDVLPEALDWPALTGASTAAGSPELIESGFAIAHEALGSTVQWREQSVYDLDPDVIGKFDFVFAGSLLGHLRDPVAALESIAGVLRGELLSVDVISAPLTLRHPRAPLARFEGCDWPLWWVPNLQAYRKLFPAGRLAVVESGRPFFVKRGLGYSGPYGMEGKARREPLHRRAKHALTSRLGNLHAWVLATPSTLAACGA
jgi:tRNA (mo5U34)-methyltransferase